MLLGGLGRRDHFEVATSGQLEDREALFFVNRQQLQDAPAKRALVLRRSNELVCTVLRQALRGTRQSGCA